MAAEQDENICCPPQKTELSAVKNAVPHPVSEKTGIELKGKIEKLGDFDEVYVVRQEWRREIASR